MRRLWILGLLALATAIVGACTIARAASPEQTRPFDIVFRDGTVIVERFTDASNGASCYILLLGSNNAGGLSCLPATSSTTLIAHGWVYVP